MILPQSGNVMFAVWTWNTMDAICDPEKNDFWSSVGLMLGQSRRRWPNIKPARVLTGIKYLTI